MDEIQRLLFGGAPRRVGTPKQHWVYSTGQTEIFIDSANGRRNVYATLGWWDFEEKAPVCDKVLFDLDSPAKEDGDWTIFGGDQPADDEVVAMMRDDPDVADQILGEVVEDARLLARRCREDNVPVVGVFSGFGIHVHQLWEPTYDPAAAMSTTAYRYVDHVGLQTADAKVFGQPERICRIPNCERVADSVQDGDHGFVVEDGRPCDLYTIPLTADELATLDVEWLLRESKAPRVPEIPGESKRSEMRVWEEYETGKEEASEVPPRPIDGSTDIADDSDLRWLFEQLLRMPCMVERLLDDPNPDHDVRVNATVQLLNAGLHPETVVDLFAQINWVDWDREVTKSHVEHIYRNGYSDQSCSTIQGKGLCTRSEDPEACRCYGWSGGSCEWKA